MDAVRVITGRAVPLVRSDVDTDQIIPSDWLKRVERTGFGAGLFSEWRENSDFVLNQERYDGANILVAGTNFGTGSSREHAVWALMDYGFQAVIVAALRRHLPQQQREEGLVCRDRRPRRRRAAVGSDRGGPEARGRRRRRAQAGRRARDRSRRTVRARRPHAVPAVNGLDDIGLTLRNEDKIAAYEADRSAWKPALD